MLTANYLILYVASAEKSAAFYGALLGAKPVHLAPDFALFALPSGLMLGLWTRETVLPAFAGAAGAAEFCLTAPDADSVDAVCAEWRAKDIEIIQSPETMDFGRTFAARDPDGHRIRVFAEPAKG